MCDAIVWVIFPCVERCRVNVGNDPVKEPVIIDDWTSPALSSILTSLPLIRSLQLEIYTFFILKCIPTHDRSHPFKHEHVQNLICTISSILVLTLRLESALFLIDDRTFTDLA